MNITKEGFDLRHTKYTVGCSTCKSQFTFLEHEGTLIEGLSLFGEDDSYILIECPMCCSRLRYRRKYPEGETKPKGWWTLLKRRFGL